MKRCGHQIQSKRGATYALDRSTWSTHCNFDNMYSHIYREMEDECLATRLEEPVWMDRSENIVDKHDTIGCKVIHDIIIPDMCVVGYEVGANISMKGNGHAGGYFMLCERGTIP